MREEPKSIFLSSIPLASDFQFVLLLKDSGDFRSNGAMLKAGGYYMCIAQALPLPLTGAFSQRPSLEAVSVQAAAASRALNNICLSSEQQQKKEIEGGNLLVFCKSMQPPTSCVSKATTSSSIKKCIFRNLVKGSTKNALSVDKGWI